MTSRTPIIGVLTTGLVLFAVAARAVQVPERRTDHQIRTHVEHRLAGRDLRGVTVIVRQGEVTLEGIVSNAWARNQAYEQARQVEGVKGVVCKLVVTRGISDPLIAQEVEWRILGYPFYTLFDNVEIAVRDGRVMLTGEVMADARARALVEIAAKVDGVVEVVNFIRTLPFCLTDNEIRYEIAGPLYDNPMLYLHADSLLAPVHIIVEYGHVKLTGTVESEAERRTAEILALGIPGVISVENKLKTRRGRLT